jgi:hypothetical protein
MKGLAIGEESSAANPVLQLFCRSGQFLQDLDSGTFKIEDIRIPRGAPTEKVAETSFNSGHKLSTGRYVIPTGSTSSWGIGTYRAVCSYKMSAAGPTYTQVIEFEVLDNGDWVTGNLFCSYASTRRLIADEYIGATASLQRIHRHLDKVSKQIEAWTKRWFEPRYLIMRADGPKGKRLFLQEAILALEQVQAIWKNSSNEEETYDYDPYIFEVYNRHLDAPAFDDRSNPKIVRTDGLGWPDGDLSVKVTGVFGYTNPTLDPNAGRVLLGETPDDLVIVVGTLLTRQLADPAMANPLAQNPGLVKSMKTRDQAVSFFGATGSSRPIRSEPSGDPYIDAILAKYAPPMNVEYTNERTIIEQDYEEFGR